MTVKITKVIDLIPATVKPIESVDANQLDEATFWSQYVCTHTPVVIKGAITAWPAYQKWHEKGYLESICDDENVAMSKKFNTVPSGNLTPKKLHECLSELHQSPDDEIFSIPGINMPKHWSKDIGGYAFLKAQLQRKNLWFPKERLFIYKNASTEWHFHPIDETITNQIVGSKRIGLFRLTNENWRHYAPFIRGNLHHLPEGQSYFPTDENQIVMYEGTIEAGDSVYIPPFWWHGIDSTDSNFGVTFAHCFPSPIRRIGDWDEPVFKDLRGKLPLAQKAYLNYQIAKSTLSRKIGQEKWWPM